MNARTTAARAQRGRHNSSPRRKPWVSIPKKFPEPPQGRHAVPRGREPELRTSESLSHIIEQCHEPEIHVQLVMAVEQGEPRIIGYEID
jgi:hypothetical protein